MYIIINFIFFHVGSNLVTTPCPNVKLNGTNFYLRMDQNQLSAIDRELRELYDNVFNILRITSES